MKTVYSLFFLLYILTPFLPSFDAADQMAFQWLYLSGINFLFFVYCLFFSKSSFELKINKSFFSFLSFVFIASLSFFAVFNTSEYLIELSRLFTVLFSLIIFIQIFTYLNFSIDDFRKGVLFFLLAECIYFFSYLLYAYYYLDILYLQGVSSNVNIQAFSIIFKIPIVLFYSQSINKSYLRTLSFISLFLSVIILLLLSSRASFLSLLIILLTFLFYNSKSILSNFLYFLKFFTPAFIVTYFVINPFFNTGSKLIGLTLINESSLSRIEFYKEALFSIVNNPILGVGLGNWKIFSIDAHKEFIKGYIIPYHAHNDFLQIAAEIGLFGAASYILFFVFLVLIFLNSKSLKNSILIKASFILTILVYFIDANLNFPISRPLIQLQLFLFISFVFATFHAKSLFSFKLSRIVISLFIVFGLAFSFASYKVYSSFTLQRNLSDDFNAQKFDTPIDIIEALDDDFPNILYTGMPIKSIKANYYTDDSIVKRFLDLSLKDNPFIKYPQALKSIRFNLSKDLDSALYYAKDAFYGLPNNELHVNTYLAALVSINDSITIDSLYPHIKKMQSYNMWKSYLLSHINTNRSNTESLSSIFDQAINLYPKDDSFKLYKIRLSKGDSILTTALNMSNFASGLYDQGKYLESANKYLEASKLVSEDPSYLENAGHSFYLANYNKKALSLFDSVINHYDSRSGKAHYLKGLMTFELYQNKEGACNLFETAIILGNKDALKAKNLICR